MSDLKMHDIEWIERNDNFYINVKWLHTGWRVGVACIVPARNGYVHTLIIAGQNHDAHVPYLKRNAMKRLVDYINAVCNPK